MRSLCSGGEKGKVAVVNGASVAPAHKTVISAGRIVILCGREEKGGAHERIERERTSCINGLACETSYRYRRPRTLDAAVKHAASI